MNLLKFFELVVLRCSNLKIINVQTSKDTRPNSDQANAFTNMSKSLHDKKRIILNISFSENIHDRQVM